jgi:hypothetical protein
MPEISDGLARVWSIFRDLSMARGSNGFGPTPISWSEILAWSALMREPLEIWEIQAIRYIDVIYLSVASKDAHEVQSDMAAEGLV